MQLPCSKVLKSECGLPMADSTTDQQQDEPNGLTLFDIAWDDVLFAKVLPLLSLRDLFNLRCCSRLSKNFVDNGFRRMRVLNLSGNNNRHIERGFQVVSRNSRNIRTVNLAKCSWLHDGLLSSFLQCNTKITRINLSECANITSASLQPIIIECKELTVLKLAHCNWLTIGAMEALTLHHSKIQELDISHCNSLNERCISVFLLNCRRLHTLSLAYLPSVTDNLLYSIAKNSKEIRHLNVIGCQMVTDRGIG